jgi:hypothetical protein
MSYNPAAWYWIVGGGGPHLESPDDVFPPVHVVFSSALDDYVSADDPTYVTWRESMSAMMGGIEPTTRIDTEQNLAAVLIAAGVPTHLQP